MAGLLLPIVALALGGAGGAAVAASEGRGRSAARATREDPEIIATGKTFDAVTVNLHSDGSISTRERFVGRGKLPTGEMWRVWGWIETYTHAELPELIREAKRLGPKWRARPTEYIAPTEEEFERRLSKQVRRHRYVNEHGYIVPVNPGERVRAVRGLRAGQVVVAWVVDTVEVVDPHLTKIDLGHRHKTRAAVEGRSVMWTRSGTEADIVKAEKYAREEAGKAAGDPYATGRDHRVFVYPPSERDPLGRARREVVR